MRLTIAFLALALTLPLSALDLAGRVVTDGDQPVANAHVYVFTALPKTGPNTICPSCYLDCGKREKVTDNGGFKLSGLDDKLKFRLLAVADGYEPSFSEYVATGPVTFKLKARDVSDVARLVRGRVLDPSDKPVVGAVVEPQGVRIGNRTGYGAIPGVDPLSITNDKGEFALRVPADATSLSVRARARNFAPEIARDLKPAADGQVVRVDVGASIAGRLVREGKPVAGVRVGFDHKDRASRNFLGTETIGTDEKGVFLITGLGPDQEYYVYLDGDQGAVGAAQRGKLVKTGADGTSVELGDVELK